MNRMRFAALLVNTKEQLGFYLSHRVILTLAQPGCVRAVTTEEFGSCQVFTKNNVAISFFTVMTEAANSTQEFPDSLAMLAFFLHRPEITMMQACVKSELQPGLVVQACVAPASFSSGL